MGSTVTFTGSHVGMTKIVHDKFLFGQLVGIQNDVLSYNVLAEMWPHQEEQHKQTRTKPPMPSVWSGGSGLRGGYCLQLGDLKRNMKLLLAERCSVLTHTISKALSSVGNTRSLRGGRGMHGKAET